MSNANLRKKLFVTNSNTIIPWERTEGNHLVKIATFNEYKRGYHNGAHIISTQHATINHILTKWAKLKFIFEASLEGSLQVQAQTPLNFFKETGLALRLEAIAKAAVAIGIESDITVEQLLEQILKKPNMKGLSGEILKLINEEFDLEGVLYGQAAIAIMAYSDMVVTGSFFSSDDVPEPGFQMLFDYGYGFIAGAGYRCFIQANMKNPNRLVYKSTELIVDNLIKIVNDNTSPEIRIVEAPLKMGLRLSYEMGFNIAQSSVHSESIMQSQVIKVIMEEGKKWFGRQFVRFGADILISILHNENINTPTSNKIINLIKEMSNDISKEKDYLEEFLAISRTLSAEINSIQNKEKWTNAIAIFWSGLILYRNFSEEIQQKELTTIIYPEIITTFINNQLGLPTNTPLQLKDLIAYLSNEPLTFMLQQNKEFSIMIQLFQDIFHGNPQNVVKELFTYKHIFNSPNSDTTIRLLYNGLQKLNEKHYIQSFSSLLHESLNEDSEELVLLNSSVLPALEISLKVVLPEMLNSFPSGITGKGLMVEAISSALLPCIGRTFIRLFDEILNQTKENFSKGLHSVGNKIDHVMAQFENNYPPMLLKYLHKPMSEALNFFGEFTNNHLHPPDIFKDAMNIFTPISKINALNYINELKSPIWIPRKKELDDALTKMAVFMLQDMTEFSTKMIIKLLKAILDKLTDEIYGMIDIFEKLVKNFTNAIVSSLENITSDAITDHFLDYAKGLVTNVPKKVLKRFVQKQVNTNIFQHINYALKDWGLDPELDTDLVLDAIRKDYMRIHTFKNFILADLEQHLKKKLVNNKKLGFSVKIHGNNFGSVHRPTSEIVSIIISELEIKFPWEAAIIKFELLENALKIFAKELEINNFVASILELKQDYSINLLKN
ncbi:hypothetical protein [Bacillus thuringiensis]|uniref:hypothetical protein n=1 Tax=Bacillus thuringiensis TaxID=1428 RepID=UPI0021D65A1D|nr:hypothetical protein [Bacillus thuringiensis]MCU7679187.1 hypothetical protein [Bacillus thuringiensis]